MTFTEELAVWLATEAAARSVSQNDIVNEALAAMRASTMVTTPETIDPPLVPIPLEPAQL